MSGLCIDIAPKDRTRILMVATCGHSGAKRVILARWASLHNAWLDVEETHLCVRPESDSVWWPLPAIPAPSESSQ